MALKGYVPIEVPDKLGSFSMSDETYQWMFRVSASPPSLRNSHQNWNFIKFEITNTT